MVSKTRGSDGADPNGGTPDDDRRENSRTHRLRPIERAVVVAGAGLLALYLLLFCPYRGMQLPVLLEDPEQVDSERASILWPPADIGTGRQVDTARAYLDGYRATGTWYEFDTGRATREASGIAALTFVIWVAIRAAHSR